MLNGIEVRLDVDFLKEKNHYQKIAKKIIYTGPIDEYFDNKLGKLEYRSLQFKTKVLEKSNFQGNAVINYTDRKVPFTRIIEHKHFDQVETKHTVITEEYPSEWEQGDEPYYPINDDKNMVLFKKYRQLAKSENVIFGGRLSEYKYYDMHQVIRSALTKIERIKESL